MIPIEIYIYKLVFALGSVLERRVGFPELLGYSLFSIEGEMLSVFIMFTLSMSSLRENI